MKKYVLTVALEKSASNERMINHIRVMLSEFGIPNTMQVVDVPK